MSIGVLEVGGTHVSAATVDPVSWRVVICAHHELDAAGSRASLLTVFHEAAASLPVPVSAAAVPSPFDYERGIALYEGVGKFEALYGVDLGAELGSSVVFTNDADAFALGAWWERGSPTVNRLVGLTLGTGVGSGFVADGAPVLSGDVPPDGMAHLLSYDGRPLEDTMSRRALRAAYGTGDDVREIAQKARDRDPHAVAVLSHALRALGQTIGPWLIRFGAERVVVGGSISRSWDLLGPWFAEGCARTGADLPVTTLDDPDAPFIGAALAAR